MYSHHPSGDIHCSPIGDGLLHWGYSTTLHIQFVFMKFYEYISYIYTHMMCVHNVVEWIRQIILGIMN